MSWLWPKTYLKWREPAEVVRCRDDLETAAMSPWLRPILVGICWMLFMTQWLLAWLIPNNIPPPLVQSLSVTLLGSLILVYGLPFLFRPFFRRYGFEIRITDQGVAMTLMHQTVWRWSDIKSCEIAAPTPEGRPAILALTKSNGATRILGVGKRVPLDELRRLMASRNVEVCTHARSTSR